MKSWLVTIAILTKISLDSWETLWRVPNDSTYGFMSHFDSSWECLNWLNGLASVLYGFVAWLFTSINFSYMYTHKQGLKWSCLSTRSHPLGVLRSTGWSPNRSYHSHSVTDWIIELIPQYPPGNESISHLWKSENRTFPRKNHLDRVVSN